MLYEMLVGHKPYEADTPAGFLIKQTSQPLPVPRQFAPTIPPAVEAAVLKSLDRDPAGRFPDMGILVKVFEELLAPGTNVNAPTDYFKTVYAASTLGSAEGLRTNAAAPISKRPAWKMILIGLAAIIVLGGVFGAGMTLSKGLPALADPSETPTITASMTWTPLPSKTPTYTFTPPPTDTPTATMTSTPACADFDVSGFWIGKQEEVLKDYAKSLKIKCGTYSNPDCDKYVSYPILLMLSQNGCDVSGQYGTGSSIFGFKPTCDINGTIKENTITFPLQSCLFTGTAAQLEFFSGKLVDELNGGLPVCKNQSTGTYTVSCYIHLERENRD